MRPSPTPAWDNSELPGAVAFVGTAPAELLLCPVLLSAPPPGPALVVAGWLVPTLGSLKRGSATSDAPVMVGGAQRVGTAMGVMGSVCSRGVTGGRTQAPASLWLCVPEDVGVIRIPRADGKENVARRRVCLLQLGPYAPSAHIV